MDTARSLLCQRAENMGRLLIDNQDDGNCLFDAVSDQLNGTQSSQELRKLTVETL